MNVKNRQKWLAVLAAAVVAIWAVDKLLLTPLTRTWKVRSAKLVDLRKKAADGQSLIAREATLRSRWSQMLSSTLPKESSQAEQQLLQAFDRWAQDSRVTILSISPQWKQEDNEHLTLECRVEAAGSLDTVGRFLYEMEKDPLAVRLQTVELTSRDAEGQQIALGLQVSGLVLTAAEIGAGSAPRSRR